MNLWFTLNYSFDETKGLQYFVPKTRGFTYYQERVMSKNLKQALDILKVLLFLIVALSLTLWLSYTLGTWLQ